MAYTIVKSDGTVLTTIADGTINTTSTSMGLFGKNYAGYGQYIDTNFVHHLENFAAPNPPANPLRGQLWYNTNSQTLCVCPTDGESNALAWTTLTATSSGSSSTFGNITVTGNAIAANVSVTNNANISNTLTAQTLVINSGANIGNANLSGTTQISNVTTTYITSGSATTAGSMNGVWTITGSAGGAKADSLILGTGGIAISNSSGANLYGIKCDKYMWANGDPISFSGTYSNSNVAAYLPTYTGEITASKLTTTQLSTGSNVTTGNITGNWSLTAGSRLEATYADLAERHQIDEISPVGTVVKVGGNSEITKTSYTDEAEVLGVISNTAAYLMNAGAGNDQTHPPIALVGRVSVRVVGPIEKGDKITTADNGRAMKSSSTGGFGWALETNSMTDEKLVLCVIK